MKRFNFHHLGSTSSVSNRAGKIHQQFDYLPTGEIYNQENFDKYDSYYNNNRYYNPYNILFQGILTSSGYSAGDRANPNSAYRFNGKEIDENTGLYYYGARYYDPTLSQFLSVDPMAEARPWENPYSYCGNNPLNRVDPTGMIWDETSQKTVKIYEKEINSRIGVINEKLQNLKEGSEQYTNLSNQLIEYKSILSEITDLGEDQNNLYKINYTSSIGANGKLEYGGQTGGGLNIININLSSKLKNPALSLGTLSHELKHAHQYFSGYLGFAPDGININSYSKGYSNNSKLLERVAFTRGDMFSGNTMINNGKFNMNPNLNPATYQLPARYSNFPEFNSKARMIQTYGARFIYNKR